MARPRKLSAPQLSPGQASYVLERMIEERRVSRGEVSRYVADMQREIDDLERRLQSLREATARGASMPRSGQRRGRQAAAPAARRGRRGGSVTPQQRASRQIQGRYLGLFRQIPASRRSQYQKIARERGREAAIKEMASALGK